MKTVIVALMLMSAGLLLAPQASAWHCSPMPYYGEIVCRAGEAVCAMTCRYIAIEGSDSGIPVLP